MAVSLHIPFTAGRKKRTGLNGREKSFGGQESSSETAAKMTGNDYRNCSLTPAEAVLTAAAGILLICVLGRLFYRSSAAAAMMSPLILLLFRYVRRVKGENRRQRLTVQFRDGALSVAAAMTSGYSVENAFRTAAEEMCLLYGEDGIITTEFRQILRRIELNETAEDAVRDLAFRSGCREIQQFADVFAAAKRSSGQIAPVLKDTADWISRRIAVQEEIRTLIAAKRLEQRIMCVMPAGILVYINLGDPGFTDPLYRTIAGRIIMTLCLIIYAAAFCLGERIMRTEV